VRCGYRARLGEFANRDGLGSIVVCEQFRILYVVEPWSLDSKRFITAELGRWLAMGQWQYYWLSLALEWV